MTLNANQWFETGVDSYRRHEIHLPAHITAEMLKKYRSNKTFPLGNKANLVAPNRNSNNNNNITDVNMLDLSDEENKLELDYEMK